jgi:hypothetical protein
LLPSYPLLQTCIGIINLKDSDVMSIDIIAATENVSAIEVATRIEWRGIRRNAKNEDDRDNNNCSKKYWY